MLSILKKDLIYNQLRDNILSGKMIGKLPKELDLARELGVGKITLRAALERLQSESLISRVHGRGTFVTSEKERLDKKQTLLFISKGEEPSFSPNTYIIPEAYQYAVQKGFKPEIIYAKQFLELSEQELHTYVTRRNICGIFLAMTYFKGNEPIVTRLKALELPVVLPHPRHSVNKTTGFGMIYVDKSLAVDAAIDYLIAKGHRKIAFIGHKDSPFPFRKKSLQDILSILKKNGCSTNPEYFPSVSYGEEVSKRIRNIMALDDFPTALILFSDFFAIYAYRAIKSAGKIIPNDISVMGICGCPDVDMVTPHLTTVDFKYSLLAQKSIDLLINHKEWFSSGKQGPLVYSDFKIVERESISNIKIKKTNS